MKEALLIIDVQNDYFPGGSNELHNPYEAENRIRELIADSRRCDRPVVYIQHINPPMWFKKHLSLRWKVYLQQ